ncbi:MerR family transcriptional regulator [Levilactobacillus tongjiangensis]|uniref:MerR family transcriptional regulator n=1 Tax=Levilactobacillus tongjiangensis TaxID=2486023 RepID=A0ABW1STJ6_9LACO|nr:MerR family transcriptional regulator [Levilactobacillus tongjiangensis]
MMEDSKNLLKKVTVEKLSFGIGDVAAATGVSQSQLRYWESKGYIQSEVINGSKNRKFTYKTLINVQQIKTSLDDGFTLAGAAKQMQTRADYFDTLRSFFESRFEGMAVTDERTEINLGAFDPEPGKDLVARRVENKWQFTLIDHTK